MTDASISSFFEYVFSVKCLLYDAKYLFSINIGISNTGTCASKS